MTSPWASRLATAAARWVAVTAAVAAADPSLPADVITAAVPVCARTTTSPTSA
ncbi:hypothetical protein ThrDRAFT_01399 [Frankia casuarinae]|uniref:hypothetical protein n=1 Tax=Frankia TaxID=1854 RepID=UPI0003CFBFD8|nr:MULTISPECIES: hypothetical protein [Frankia]ETA02246.1 hypothetical protein CcI6DRAFT_02234 [Frankia sp. CcI6]EYT93015.1 hypothetical protein ThrDRAFT_01399 [Frankia casuarinae]OAA22331.1 hypothetical protein AAY23_10676 [Frankia casuarinae]